MTDREALKALVEAAREASKRGSLPGDLRRDLYDAVEAVEALKPIGWTWACRCPCHTPDAACSRCDHESVKVGRP